VSDKKAGGLETRHYIGLTPGGVRISATFGPGAPESFNTPAWQPAGAEGVTYYQVSQEVADEYMADDEEFDAEDHDRVQ
jgi:hypothetical protein